MTDQRHVDHPGGSSIAARIAAVQRRISAAELAADRAPGSVRLLPVSKTVDAAAVAEAIDAGYHRFGENRVQEVVAKAPVLGDRATWSVIGPLQTNKAKFVAELADEFQALDSVKVAEALQRRLEGFDRRLDVMVQVNVSGEATKSGVAPGDAAALVAALAPFDRLRPIGLMTIGAHVDDPAIVRTGFATLRQLLPLCAAESADPSAVTELSMGMSGDLELAVAEGSTVVRVGTAIFGARPPVGDAANR